MKKAIKKSKSKDKVAAKTIVTIHSDLAQTLINTSLANTRPSTAARRPTSSFRVIGRSQKVISGFFNHEDGGNLSSLNHLPSSKAQFILAPEEDVAFTKTAYGTIMAKRKSVEPARIHIDEPDLPLIASPLKQSILDAQEE